MSNLIPYPSHIKPSRVTVQLARSDEIFISPLTGAQQAASRGNAYWQWTIEYDDLSLSERDIVQSFLTKCKGPLNYFKIPDFGLYSISGGMSDWVDLFNNDGEFVNAAQASEFTLSANMDFDIFQGEGLNSRRQIVGTLTAVRKTFVNSLNLVQGATYIARSKFHSNDPMSMALSVGSLDQQLFSTNIFSIGQNSAPVFIDEATSRIDVSIKNQNVSNAKVGDSYRLKDFQFSRCLLVSNSENLLTQSNSFEDAHWSLSRSNLLSSYDTGHDGVSGAAWKYFKDAQVNTRGLLFNTYSKVQTEDIFTASIYAKADELSELEIRMYNNGEADRVDAVFWLNSGTFTSLNALGAFIRPYARIDAVGDDWYRCSVTAVANSLNAIGAIFTICSGGGNQFTSNGSDGILIQDAQLVNFPFPKQRVQTASDAVVGSNNLQTGNQLYVAGMDPDEIYFSGTRFELITRYYNQGDNVYERSEYKRMTSNVKANKEGWGVIEFEPPIRNAPVFERSNIFGDHLGETLHPAVIIDNPELKAHLVAGTIQYTEKPLQLTDITFDIIEDLSE